MKKLLAIAVVLATMAVPSMAQVRFGAKAGLAVNELKLNKGVVASDNTCGFTAGAMAEFTLPLVGLGVEASVMYVRRTAEYVYDSDKVRNHRDYISVPVNLKWRIGLPVASRFVSPFVTTGPDFSFLTSPTHFKEVASNKKFDMAWNFGFGLEVMRKVQLAASYGIGVTKSVQGNLEEALYNGKNRFWTVTAAYMF